MNTQIAAVQEYLIESFHLNPVDASVMAETMTSDSRFLELLGFTHTHGYGTADNFHETATEEDALWSADRKPEQHGGMVGERWERIEMWEREHGAYDRISELRQDRAKLVAERDRRIREAQEAIKAEYEDL